ncbi:MAG: GNAT family N-acetyltransferase [Bacteroidales bacterium]|nr:GNAT family N-acetyltransferase [Bacteroidales bacterium]
MTKISNTIKFTLSYRKDRVDTFQIWAKRDDLAVGIAIAEKRNDNCFMLHKVFVHPNFRNQGIGTELMRRAKNEIAKYGDNRLVLYYGKEENPSLVEYFMSHFGLGNARQYSVYYKVDFDVATKSLLMYFTEGDVWKDINIRYYSDLDINSIKQIEQFATQYVSNFTNPTTNTEKIVAPLCPILYTSTGELIGWTIVEELHEGELSFTLSYVQPKFRSLAIGPRMYSLVYNRMNQLGLKKYKYATFEVFCEDVRVAKLNERLFGDSIIERHPCYEYNLQLFT